MLRAYAALLAIAAADAAFTCKSSGTPPSSSGQIWDCSVPYQVDEDGMMVDVQVANVCYFMETEGQINNGCVLAEHAHILAGEEGCNEDACWCSTPNCNSAAWYAEMRANWVPPPMCYSGIVGENSGPQCYETPKYDVMEVDTPECHNRKMENQCVENNQGVGEGDGCDAHASQSTCESYRATDRDLDESYDGTARHCRWLPPFADAAAKIDACEADGQCAWADHGGGNGDCSWSDTVHSEWNLWQEQRGQRCEERAPSGCYENSDVNGQNEACTQHADAESCTAFVKGPDDHFGTNGVCSGTVKNAAGGECRASEEYYTMQFQPPSCHSRTEEERCVENNEWMGQGDGCAGHDGQFTCESYTPPGGNGRSPADSFDGSTRHCRWLPALDAPDAKKDACETDALCAWYADRGHHEEGQPVGSCEWSGEAHRLSNEWAAKQGLECNLRAPRSGCYENNDHLGQSETCTRHADANSCTAFTKGPDDHIGCTGTCEGALNANSGDTRQCAERWGEHDCGGPDGTDNGCTWTEQCCKWVPESANTENECLTNGAGTEAGLCTFDQERACSERQDAWDCNNNGEADNGCTFTEQACKWIPPPVDLEHACLTNGAGTEPGMCAFTDGQGPPQPGIVSAGFEHGLFRPADVFDGRCALVASFRTGKGSAVALGADTVSLVNSQCEDPTAWHSVAEHVGHTVESIAEYCANFVPDTSVMAALASHSAGEIISKAKQGQFASVMPGLADSMFIVTSKPEYGECLFAGGGEFGMAICTCASAGCNSQTALQFIVDVDVGPMRLLQFLDGSLAHLTSAINSIVPDLLDADGKINPANVGGITETEVDAIMLLDGVSLLTNKEELWGIIQDFVALGESIAATDATETSTTATMTFTAITATGTRTTATDTRTTATATTETVSSTTGTLTSTTATGTVTTTTNTDTTTTGTLTSTSATLTGTTFTATTATMTTAVTTTAATDTSTTITDTPTTGTGTATTATITALPSSPTVAVGTTKAIVTVAPTTTAPTTAAPITETPTTAAPTSRPADAPPPTATASEGPVEVESIMSVKNDAACTVVNTAVSRLSITRAHRSILIAAGVSANGIGDIEVLCIDGGAVQRRRRQNGPQIRGRGRRVEGSASEFLSQVAVSLPEGTSKEALDMVVNTAVEEGITIEITDTAGNIEIVQVHSVAASTALINGDGNEEGSDGTSKTDGSNVGVIVGSVSTAVVVCILAVVGAVLYAKQHAAAPVTPRGSLGATAENSPGFYTRRRSTMASVPSRRSSYAKLETEGDTAAGTAGAADADAVGIAG